VSEKENPPSNKREPVYMFNAQDIGASLHEVAADFIKTEDNEIESHWYHSQKDADLYYWRDNKKNIIKQQVSFLGQIIEWNILDGVRTGVVVEDESSQTMGGSPLVHYDRSPSLSTLRQCLDIITHIPKLPDMEKQQIMDNFSHSPNLQNLPLAEIIKRFQLKDTTPNATVFWRLWRFLQEKLGVWAKKK
jgi:hypothetical protein